MCSGCSCSCECELKQVQGVSSDIYRRICDQDGQEKNQCEECRSALLRNKEAQFKNSLTLQKKWGSLILASHDVVEVCRETGEALQAVLHDPPCRVTYWLSGNNTDVIGTHWPGPAKAPVHVNQ